MNETAAVGFDPAIDSDGSGLDESLGRAAGAGGAGELEERIQPYCRCPDGYGSTIRDFSPAARPIASDEKGNPDR
jgi:hypothetical protein